MKQILNHCEDKHTSPVNEGLITWNTAAFYVIQNIPEYCNILSVWRIKLKKQSVHVLKLFCGQRTAQSNQSKPVGHKEIFRDKFADDLIAQFEGFGIN